MLQKPSYIPFYTLSQAYAVLLYIIPVLKSI